MRPLRHIEKKLKKFREEIDKLLVLVEQIEFEVKEQIIDPIDDLDVPYRVCSTLKSNGIHSISQLKNAMVDVTGFKNNTHGIGWQTVGHIQQALEKHNDTPRVDEDAQS